MRLETTFLTATALLDLRTAPEDGYQNSLPWLAVRQSLSPSSELEK